MYRGAIIKFTLLFLWRLSFFKPGSIWRRLNVTSYHLYSISAPNYLRFLLYGLLALAADNSQLQGKALDSYFSRLKPRILLISTHYLII